MTQSEWNTAWREVLKAQENSIRLHQKAESKNKEVLVEKIRTRYTQ